MRGRVSVRKTFVWAFESTPMQLKETKRTKAPEISLFLSNRIYESRYLPLIL